MVRQCAFVEKGNCSRPGMWMWTDIQATSRRQSRRIGVVEKHERTHASAQTKRKQTLHGKTIAEVVPARFDQQRCPGRHRRRPSAKTCHDASIGAGSENRPAPRL